MLDFGSACGDLPHPQHVVQVCMPLPSHHGQVTFRSATQPHFSPLPLHVPHVRLPIPPQLWHVPMPTNTSTNSPNPPHMEHCTVAVPPQTMHVSVEPTPLAMPFLHKHRMVPLPRQQGH